MPSDRDLQQIARRVQSLETQIGRPLSGLTLLSSPQAIPNVAAASAAINALIDRMNDFVSVLRAADIIED